MTVPVGPLAQLDIAVEHMKFVNLALQHIDVPLVRRVVVTNRGTADVGPLSFRFEVDPPVASVFRHEILDTLRPGESLELDERVIVMPLSSAYLARQLESERGSLRVTVATPDAERTETRRVDIQAFNEWIAVLHPETLACFVQPNHPSLVPLLQRAQDQLASTTGSSSLEGYQSGPARARLIVAALWASAQAEAIHYIEPPGSAGSSWTVGQKVLLPDAVVRDRMGTCLDLTILFASLCQRVGLPDGGVQRGPQPGQHLAQHLPVWPEVLALGPGLQACEQVEHRLIGDVRRVGPEDPPQRRSEARFPVDQRAVAVEGQRLDTREVDHAGTVGARSGPSSVSSGSSISASCRTALPPRSRP